MLIAEKQKTDNKKCSMTYLKCLFGSSKIFCCVCLLSMICMLLSSGCAGNNKVRAVELYIDAEVFNELGEKQRAVKKLNAAVEADRNFSLAYSLLGKIYEQLDDYQNSAASYEKATSLNPLSFEDFFNLGRVYQLMKKFVKAIEAYSTASELEPLHLETRINTAQSYFQIEDYNNALNAAMQAENIDPNTSEVQKLLGDIYGSKKDYDQAIGSYKRALETDSNNPAIMSSLGVVYLKTGRNEPAQKLLTSVTEQQPLNNSAWQYLGYCYLQLNSRAVQTYTDAMKEEGEDIEFLTGLKQNAEKTMKKAVDCYNRAIEIDNNDWQAHRGLGVAFMLQSLNASDETLKDQAIEQWNISLEIKSDQPRRERLLRLIKKYSK